jgi:nucleoid DNA-binding protein
MGKPESMTVGEWLTIKASQSLNIPKKTVHAIVCHQFDSALEAMKTNNSVELYSFGKLHWNTKKAINELAAQKRMLAVNEKRVLSKTLPADRIQASKTKVEGLKKKIELLTIRIENGRLKDLRRLEE